MTFLLLTIIAFLIALITILIFGFVLPQRHKLARQFPSKFKENKMFKSLNSRIALGAALVTSGVQSAMAAYPAEVDTAIDTGTTDGTAIAYKLLAFAVAIGVVMYIKRRAG